MKFILLGCGILTGLFILGMGGCAGIFYAIYKGSDSTAEIGAAYLRNAPEVQRSLGEGSSVKRNFMGWNVHVVNDGGNANFVYSLLGPKGDPKGEATVWLIRSAGKWAVVGASVRPSAGDPFTVGKPPAEHHRIKWDD